MEGVPVSVLKSSDSNENISGIGEEHQHKHRCFEGALARAGGGDPGMESTALGWGNPAAKSRQTVEIDTARAAGTHTNCNSHFWLLLGDPSSFAKPCRLSLNQFSHSLPALCSTGSADHVCPSHYHCDTHPGASQGLTQQEQNKLLLSSQRFGIEISNGTGRQRAEKILFYHTKQTRVSEKSSWALSYVGLYPAVRNLLC